MSSTDKLIRLYSQFFHKRGYAAKHCYVGHEDWADIRYEMQPLSGVVMLGPDAKVVPTFSGMEVHLVNEDRHLGVGDVYTG